jgi:hypothetical protein
MPTYFVSVSVSRPAGLNDEALIRLFHGAAQNATYVPIEVAPNYEATTNSGAIFITVPEPTTLLRHRHRSSGRRCERIEATSALAVPVRVTLSTS